MSSVLQDVRFGLRMLGKNPGFTAIAVLTLALGIGANTAIFSIIDAVMLRVLPVWNPEQLVTIGDASKVHSFGTGTPRVDAFSYPLYREVRDHNSVFSSVLASSNLSDMRITVQGTPEKIAGRLVSENYFETLGVQPLLGRFFAEDEGRVPGGDPLAVISYGYWQRRFSGDPGVLGLKVRLNNYPFTIVGVAPPGFFGEVVGDRIDVWAPMMMQAQLMPGREFLDTANTSALLLIGRRKPGVTLEQANLNVNAVVKAALTTTLNSLLSTDDRNAIQNRNMTVPVSDGSRGLSRIRREFAGPLLLLMALVALVLLAACVNVAGLLLARSETRQREIAIRFAVGAGALRIARQFLVEAMLLACAGGALGWLLANWSAPLLVNMATANHSGGGTLAFTLNWRVLAFTASICFGSAIGFGLAPAARFLRRRVGPVLKESSARTGGSTKNTAGRVLMSAQVALSVLVLMTASLLVRSLRNLQEADLGYSRDQLLLADVDALSSGYKGPQIQNLTRELLQRLANVPGVRSVTASSNGLYSGNESSDRIRLDGREVEGQDAQVADDEVGPKYFSTIGAPILMGREIDQRDFDTGARVAVVNEAFAKFYFGERSLLGHKVSVSDFDHPQPAYEIIGVARDVRDHDVRAAARRRVYAPLTSASFDENGGAVFELRAAGNPEALIRSVRGAIAEVDPNLVVNSMETAGELVSATLVSQIAVAKLSISFAVLALILVCIGLYGSMAYRVAARTKEIGVRMALGAPRFGVIWIVAREASLMLGAGIVAGLPLGVGASRLFKALLFGVGQADPVSVVLVVLVLTAICAAAAVIPARRAIQVDPLVALRYE